MQLDDLARSARSDLAESVKAMRVPPPASPRARRAASVLSLVALIVAVVALAVTRNGRDREEGFVDSGASRYFVLDTEGTPWHPVAVPDATDSTTLRSSLAFFGLAGEEDPFEVKDALVVIAPELALAGLTPNVTVNAAPAYYRAGVDLGPGGGGLVRELVFTSGGRAVILESRHLDQQSMIEVAEGLRIEGDEVVLDNAAVGMSRIGSMQRPEAERSVTYRDARPDAPAAEGAKTIELTARAGGEDVVLQRRWYGGVPTLVDGRPAMLLEGERATGGSTFELTWLRADGVVLSIGSAASEAEARALAGRVREVNETEWRQVQESMTVSEEPPPQPQPTGASTSIASNRRTVAGGDDGVRWIYSRQGDNSWCLVVPVGDRGSSDCVGRRGTEAWAAVRWLLRVTAVTVNGRNVSVLATTDDVVALRITRPDGVRIDYRRLPDTVDDESTLFVASAAEVAASPADASGSAVEVVVTLRSGTVSSTSVSMPELFRRTS